MVLVMIDLQILSVLCGFMEVYLVICVEGGVTDDQKTLKLLCIMLVRMHQI